MKWPDLEWPDLGTVEHLLHPLSLVVDLDLRFKVRGVKVELKILVDYAFLVSSLLDASYEAYASYKYRF